MLRDRALLVAFFLPAFLVVSVVAGAFLGLLAAWEGFSEAWDDAGK